MTIPGSERARLVAILLLAIGLQLLLVRAQGGFGRPLFGDEINYHEQALVVASGHLPVPDFIWPPLGGWVLGLIYAAAGPTRQAVFAVQVVLFLGAGLCLRSLARRVLGGTVLPDLAAALFLLDPQVAAFTQYLWPEVLQVFLALAGCALLFGGGEGSRRRLLAGGVLIGLALLTKNILGPFVPVLALAAAMRGAGVPRRSRVARAALVLAGVALVVAPVIAWNGVRYGTWAVADAAPLNVWQGITDPPGRSYDRNAGSRGGPYVASGATPAERNRWAREQIRSEVERQGGWLRVLGRQLAKQYPRLLFKDCFFTDQLPGGRIATREARLDGPPLSPLVAWTYLVWGAVLALAALGLCLLDREALRRGLGVAVLFLAYNAALFVFVLAKTRFRIPFLPALDLLAAFAVGTLAAGPRPGRLAARLAAGAALAAAGLYAAFG